MKCLLLLVLAEHGRVGPHSVGDEELLLHFVFSVPDADA